jgi:diguanylate cyclase (GGDEF)-like protein
MPDPAIESDIPGRPEPSAQAPVKSFRGTGVAPHDAELPEGHLTGGHVMGGQVMGRLRRMEVLDLLIERIGREASVEAMMDVALWTLLHALGAEGAAIVGPRAAGCEAEVLHACGPGTQAAADTALLLLARRDAKPLDRAPDGRLLMLVVCPTRFGAQHGLVFWRAANGLAWAGEDIELAGAAAGVVRIILDHEAVSYAMAHQARTDPLTGLMTRGAFIEELRRHVTRLDREQAPGTMIVIDLDGFKLANDRFGHTAGDRILMHVADRLRRLVRPNDLISRMGGDQFAVWLSGADHMTAAERADMLCKTMPGELQALLAAPAITVGLSIGIATRQAGSREPVEEILRRADSAMYQARHTGRGQWRVWLGDQL